MGLKDKLDNIEIDLKTMTLQQLGSKHNDAKVDKLDTAQGLIQYAKDVLKMAIKIVWKKTLTSNTVGSEHGK
jgi:hypothetical protein